MSIRKKIFLIFALVGIILLATTVGVSKIIINGFLQIEKIDTEQNVNRVKDALFNNINDLSTKLSDWSAWDDTYKFVQDKNEAYITSNLQANSLTALKINTMLFFDKDQNLIYEKNVNLADSSEVVLPQDLLDYLKKGSTILTHNTVTSAKQGILNLKSGIFLFASRPIITSKFTGPIQGTLIFGRYLDTLLVQNFSQVTHLDAHFYQAGAGLPTDLQSIQPQISSGGIKVIPNGTTVSGVSAINDFFGKKTAVVKVNLARNIYNQGQKSIYYLIAILIASELFIISLLFFLLNTQIFKKLFIIISEVHQVGANKDAPLRLSVEKNSGEFSQLSKEINIMLDSFRYSQKLWQDERKRNDIYVNVLGVMIVVLAAQGAIMLFNKKAKEITGENESEVLGKSWIDMFVNPAEKEKVKSLVEGMFKGEVQPFEKIEYSIVSKDQTQKLIKWSNSVLKNESGIIVAIIMTGDDITKEREEELALQRQKEELEKMNELMVGRELKMKELKQKIAKYTENPEQETKEEVST